MRRAIIFCYIMSIIILLVYSCKHDNSLEKQKEEIGIIYIRKYDVNTTNVLPEQFSDNFEYKIDTFKYKISKPLGEYHYAYNRVFSDSILNLWNKISIENIIKTDPKLLYDGNYIKHQVLNAGDNYRTEFWRMINCFYFSLYDFNTGFFVVEIINSSSNPHYNALYLITSNSHNKSNSYQFRFGTWDNSELMAYLKDSNEMDYNAFYSYYIELKKQNTYDEFIGGPTELTVSYFCGDTIESYVNIEYVNFEIMSKIEKLLDGNK